MKKIISLILCVTLLLTIGTVISGCGESVEDNPKFTKQFVFFGPSGFAKLMGVNYEYYDDLKDDVDFSNKQKYDYLSDYYKKNGIKIVSGAKNGKLSNGDVLTLKFENPIPEELVKEYNFTKDLYTSEEFTYVVNGLPEPKVVDNITKDDISVEYSGVSGYVHVSVTRKDDYKYPIDVEIPNNGSIKNGEKFNVVINLDHEYDPKNIEDKKYTKFIFKDDKPVVLEYTIDEIPEIPDTLDGVDTTTIDKQLFDFMKKLNNKSAINEIEDGKLTVYQPDDFYNPYSDTYTKNDIVGDLYKVNDEVFFDGKMRFLPKNNYDAIIFSTGEYNGVNLKENYFVKSVLNGNNNRRVAYYAKYICGKLFSELKSGERYNFDVYECVISPVVVKDGQLMISNESQTEFGNIEEYDSGNYIPEICKFNTKSGIVENFKKYVEYKAK